MELMQVDISRQIFRWKALDRWENEGGSVPLDGIEPDYNDPSGIRESGVELFRNRADTSTSRDLRDHSDSFRVDAT